jgi:hypothetical protein
MIRLPIDAHLQSLKAHEKGERLQAEVAAIDKVTKKDEVLLARARHGVNGDARVCPRALTTAGLASGTRAAARLLVVIIITVGALDTAIRATNRFLEGRIGDLGGRFDIIGIDNGCRSLHIGLTRHTARNAEQLQEVVELTMDITADRDRSTNRLDVRLCKVKLAPRLVHGIDEHTLHQACLDDFTELLHRTFWQVAAELGLCQPLFDTGIGPKPRRAWARDLAGHLRRRRGSGRGKTAKRANRNLRKGARDLGKTTRGVVLRRWPSSGCKGTKIVQLRAVVFFVAVLVVGDPVCGQVSKVSRSPRSIGWWGRTVFVVAVFDRLVDARNC